MRYLSLLLALILTGCTTPAVQPVGDTAAAPAPAGKIYDLDNRADNLEAFMKVRGSLVDDEEVIYYANGKIYGFVDGERDKPLMGFEMYNIGRVRKLGEGDYQLLTNEVLLYTDLETGEVLETFANPYTGKTVDILHVWNSPVNQSMKLEGKYGPWMVNWNRYGEDVICMNADVFLAYPSPLKVAEFPDNSASDLYEAAELFQFFFSEDELNSAANSIDCTISWTRIGPWLPWLEMGQRPGRMVYQGAGYKLLEKDYDKMPAVLRNYVAANNPEYRHSPTEYTQPNETSWTYFKKQRGGR